MVDSCISVDSNVSTYINSIHFIYASVHLDWTIQCRPVDDIIEEIKLELNNGKKKIVFFNNTECIQLAIFNKVQVIVELMTDVDPDTFVFIVGAVNSQKKYDELIMTYKWSRRMKVWSVDHFEQFIKHIVRKGMESGDLKNLPYQVKLKKKKYLCFNKINRSHRMKLLADMLNNKLLYQSFYSFEGKDKNWIDDISKGQIPEKFKNTVQTIIKHRNIFPLRLNITTERSNPIDIINDDFYFHEESYFSIITETKFYASCDEWNTLFDYVDMLFISEKTYKTIAMKHPFIILGCPGTIKHLKETGYKTFHPFINEFYDLEYDDDKRYAMVLEEIERLCKFTDREWLAWQSNIKDIVEYNFLNLMNKTKFHNDDIDKLFG